MQNHRSAPSAVPGDPKLTDHTLLKETDLQRCIEALQCIICDLLIENERLRQLTFPPCLEIPQPRRRLFDPKRRKDLVLRR
jgi:hypothetical protein